MNFTLYFTAASSGHNAYKFHFVNGKMKWAMDDDGVKETDAEIMSVYLQDAQNTGLPAHVVIAEY